MMCDGSSAVEHGHWLYDERGLPRVIVGTSAVLAILFLGADAERYARASVHDCIDPMYVGRSLPFWNTTISP